MTIKYYPELIQGTDEWYEARRGIITSSVMKQVVTAQQLKPSCLDKKTGKITSALIYELAAQRITGHVEDSYINDDMIRGHDDEVRAKELYSKKYAPVTEMGFITNDKWGYTLGFSPDGLVSEDGMVECKSRDQKFQFSTILLNEMPDDFKLQVNTAFLVSERKWLDFLSYSGGMPMYRKRIYPDEEVCEKILEACDLFEKTIKEYIDTYHQNVIKLKLPPTERVVEQEIVI